MAIFTRLVRRDVTGWFARRPDAVMAGRTRTQRLRVVEITDGFEIGGDVAILALVRGRNVRRREADCP